MRIICDVQIARWGCYLCGMLLLFSMFSVRESDGDDTKNSLVRGFVDEAWRDPPSIVDMRIKVRVLRSPRSEQVIRQQIASSVTSNINQMNDSSTRPLSATEINAEIDSLVRDVVTKEGHPQYHFQRFRTDGASVRIDTVQQSEDGWRETEVFDESRVFLRSPQASSNTEIITNFKAKSCTADTTRSRPMFAIPDYPGMGMQERALRSMLRAMTGKKESELVLVADPKRVSDFVDGKSPLVAKVEQDVLNGVAALRFDFAFSDKTTPIYTVYCVEGNVTQPLLHLVRDTTGGVIRRLEQSSYEDDGFPRYWKETVVKADGSEEYEERLITNIDLTIVPPKEVFQYSVPNGFLGAYITNESVQFKFPNGHTEVQAREPKKEMAQPVARPNRTILWINFSILVAIFVFVTLRRLFEHIRRSV